MLKLFSLLSFAIISPLFNTAGDDSIKIMSYNIRFAGDETAEGINSWNNRKDNLAAVIRFHHTEIIGVQEALMLQLKDMTDLLPGYNWIGAGRDDGKNKGEFSAIFYNKNRFEVLDHATFWLSETPDDPSTGWDALLPRIVTWGKFSDKKGGKIFYVFNTHFDHVGEKARQNSAKLLLKKIEEISGNIHAVVTGDFNVKPDSEVYKLLTGKNNPHHLNDAQNLSEHGHYGSNVTYNAFGNFIEEGNKIDYIFVKNNVKVLQHGIIAETFNGNYPSDHMPVIAEIIFE
jgi:endonuclease/exonuclease/phosphatase family metal-dependent hydrolase